jgi:hypothetical protein
MCNGMGTLIMVVQQNTIFSVVSVVSASNVVFFDIKSFTMADGEGRNFRQKNIGRFPRQHGVAPQKTVLLKKKYARILKKPVSHLSSLSC